MSIVKAVHLHGDSIFDNQPYVEPNEAVVNHLKSISPMSVDLFAVDGHVTVDVIRDANRKLHTKFGKANAAIVSVGGNDALGIVDLFLTPVRHVLDTFDLLQPHLSLFEKNYEKMILKMLEHYNKENLRVCTIYDSIPVKRSAHLTESMLSGLHLFNSIITKVADRHQVSVLDLRNVCTEDSDYSMKSPIEPSSTGGMKIAKAIAATFGHPTR